MGILDIFSDNNEEQAAGTLKRGYKKGYKEATKQLGKGYKGLKNKYAAGLKTIANTTDTARGDITTGRDAALAEYDPYVEATAGVPGLYAAALGTGGAAGHDQVDEAFRTSPGYDFRMDEGLKALDRTASSRGMLASGNTDIDTLKYAGGLADQEYGSWLDRLFGQEQFGAGVAGQRAGIRTGAGTELAGLTERGGTRRAAIKTGLGDVGYGYRQDLGNLGYATALGQAGAQAQYLAGKDATGANAVGAVTGAGSLGAKLLGIV